MGETRVNLKHLLEDLRDSYPYPQEEAIITELIANALDSGASEIRFFTAPERLIMSVVDDGEGMEPQNFEEYHDIAATTKLKGKGIGFAGLGVKLALLVAEEVITETKRGSFHSTTSWKLESLQRAPWEYIKSNGMVNSSSGTAVSIIFRTKESNLLKDNFIENVIQTHFHPILDDDFMDNILKYVYKKGVVFFVNGRKIDLSETEKSITSTPFIVRLGRRDKPIGIGFLRKSREELEEDVRGLAISTYGKVIKRGWDWIGISPRNPMRLTGIVEIPKLSEILTTNKADFLKDVTSYQKYIRYRKAIQEAIAPILREFGEIRAPRERIERDLRPLEREIERVLGNMLKDFPELSTLFERRRKGEPVGGVIPDEKSPPIGTIVEGREVMTGTKGGGGEGSGVEGTKGEMPGERIHPGPEFIEPGREHEGRKRLPGVMIGFEDNSERNDLGWLMESTIWINKGHPAFRKVMDSEAENYHIILSVSWVLAGYLEGEKSSQEFINQFLSIWGAGL
jgi:hypothetical protein